VSDDADALRVRRAALRVGAWVGAASAAAVLAGVAVLLAFVAGAARPDRAQAPPRADGDRVVVDVDEIVPLILVLAVAGVLLLAAVGILAAQRAAVPLAEALRMQRSFVSDASHELRTPLTALSSRIQIIERRHARGEPIEAPLARLREDARAMDDVLTDLLLSAEAASASATRADAGASAREAVALLEPMAGPRRIELVTSVDEGLAVGIAQSTLVRLLVAMLDNAIQHSPDGARIEVRASAERGGAVLRIVDHGSGIPAEDRERVFDRFARGAETGRRRGFGIGLALVRQAAERAGGSVEVEASSPEGTTFALRLPLAS
jgi:two-component system, OmpR family, sensor kinase